MEKKGDKERNYCRASGNKSQSQVTGQSAKIKMKNTEGTDFKSSSHDC